MSTPSPRFVALVVFCAFSIMFLVNAALATTVAVDDFYVVNGVECLPTYENDVDVPGTAWLVDYHVGGDLVYYGTQVCGSEAEFHPIGTGSRLEWFTYRYRTHINPDEWSNTAYVAVLVVGDDLLNAGSCPTAPIPAPNAKNSQPINVTNGNMWLREQDYMLAGPGEPIHVDRFYNSMIKTVGLFGIGWTTQYDESLTIFPDDQMLRLNASDGRGSYFGRPNTSSAFSSFSQGVTASIIKNTDGTYNLTYKDGRIHKFDSAGKLLWLKDRNGLQTTLHYLNGVLTSVEDPVSRSLTITTGTNGRVSQLLDAFGTIATYEYFTENNVLTNKLKTVTYNDGSKYKFEYTDITINNVIQPYLTTVKDALDNVLETHQYDTSGRATTSARDGGLEAVSLQYTSDPDGPLTIVTDALQHQTKYHYTRVYGTNLITKTEGVCGCGGGGPEVTQYSYDIANSWLNLKRKTDALGNNTDYTYDANRNITQITDVLGTQTFTYNSFGEVLQATDRMSGVTTNTYDPVNGNLLTSTDPLNHTTTLTWTPLGRIETMTDARSNVTSFFYDTLGLLSRITDANGKDTTFGFDGRARLTHITNALTETTTFGYDDNNRLASITYPDSHQATMAYDAAGRRTSITDENGHATSYKYDAAYRLRKITDALNHATNFDYDPMSNLTSQTNATGNVTNFEYDDFDRLTKIIYPVPSPSATPRLEENFTYNQLGELASYSDTAGHTTNYAYTYLDNPKRRVITITEPSPLNYVTQLTFNARLQMTKVKDALNQEYNFTYDPLGRQLTETRAGTTMTYVYDEVGNRTSRTDHNGHVTNYSYDDLNRLNNINYAGSYEFADFTYDDLSRPLTAENQYGEVTFTYSNRGRLASETDVFGHVLGYSYDPAGNRTALSLDSATHTSYVYDNANRLTTLTDASSHNFTFGYDNADRLTSRTMPNGITSNFTYDGMSRLKRLKHMNTSSTLYDDQFTYNSANQISQIAGLSATRNYTYDNINRLTGMSDGTNTESYSYDAVGNRIASHRSSTYTTDPFNRLTATNSASYSYDANGSLTGKTVGSISWFYDWDRENRLKFAGNGIASAYYHLDALGRRIERLSGGDDQKYTYDGQDVVLDNVNTTVTKYQNGPGIDNKLEFAGTKTKYFLQDHLGSIVKITDSTGAVSESNSFDSFGNATNTNSSRYEFTGREYDSFTGLQFSRARWYDPDIGRFISEDPSGFLGGQVNLYRYVLNNPTKYRDPLGLDIWAFSYGASGVAGVQNGVAGSLSQMYGYNDRANTWGDAIGGATSYGIYGTPSCRSRNGFVFGLGGGGGINGVWSNADDFGKLGGDFNSHFFGIGPVQVEVHVGDDGGRPVYVLEAGPTKSWSIFPFSYANYTTTTPPRGIFTASSAAGDVAQGWVDLNRDIRGLYENQCGCH